MKRRVHRETVFMLLLFSVSVLLLSFVVLSPFCLSYLGSLLIYILLLLACYSGKYLYDRYKNI